MGVVTANSIQLTYESFGNDEDPCVMLIRGLSSQLIYWPETLIDPIVAAGYRVLTFDNRDAGLSEKIKVPCDLDEVIADLIAGEKPDVPYTLHDMATDTAALLAALDIDQAHIMGVSMGGRIAQFVAALYPHGQQCFGPGSHHIAQFDVGEPGILVDGRFSVGALAGVKVEDVRYN